MSTYAVLGLGRFGKAVAETLYENGQEILVVDRSEDLVNQCSSFADHAMIADLADEENLRSLGLENMDVVIITTAMELETTILCVMVAKEAGVPLVMAKARNKRMGDILTKVGADKVIYPEEETGIRVARTLLSKNFIDYIGISEDHGLLQMHVRPEWVGKSLKDLNLRKKYNINVIAMKNGDEKFNFFIDPDLPLSETTILFLVTDNKTLKSIG